jgi:dihydroorotase
MLMMRLKISIIFFSVLLQWRTLGAQEFSVVIVGGHVIDPKNNIDGILDVAIRDNKIALTATHIDAKRAALVIDATGYVVTPGLIDLHAHHFFGTQPGRYLNNSYEAVAPDGITFRSGVTTVVDAGSSGWRDFKIFKEQTIAHAKTRVLCFLNIVGAGMRGGQVEQNLDDMDSAMTALTIKQNAEIVGIKVAHYYGEGWDPIDRAVAAGKSANVPVMIDFGSHSPPLSVKELLFDHLRPGDIFTHAFAKIKGRGSVLDDNGNIHPYFKGAQKAGIIFDVGHGGSSFMFSQAVPAVKNGFFPNTISTDMHGASINAGMKDLCNIMSKFLTIGMSLTEVIKATTAVPAQVIHHEELGNLSIGSVADISIFSMRTGKFGFVDSGGFKLFGEKKLECELTIRDGKIVYDLNGLSKPLWQNTFSESKVENVK